MRAVAVMSVLLLVSACGEQKVVKPERKGPRPLPENTVFLPDGTRKVVTVHKKHPLYTILETEPRNEYERKLPLMLSRVVNVDALQIFCGQWFPAYGHDVADTYMDWRKKHEGTIKELTGRSEAVWADYVGEDKEYVRLVYPHLRKQMLAAINKDIMDKVTATLTDDQKKAFKDLTGEAVDVAAIQRESAAQFQGRRKKKDD